MVVKKGGTGLRQTVCMIRINILSDYTTTVPLVRISYTVFLFETIYLDVWNDSVITILQCNRGHL